MVGLNALHRYFDAFICGSISVLCRKTQNVLGASFPKFMAAVQVNLLLLR